MKKLLLASALGLALVMTGTTIARDHSVPAAKENSVYQALAETIYDSFDHEGVFKRTLERVLVAKVFLNDEDLRLILSTAPEFPALIAEEMAPEAMEIMATRDARYRTDLKRLLAEHLTPLEAGRMNDFMASSAGQEIMTALGRNYRGEREMFDVVSGNGIVGLESTTGDWEEAWQRSVTAFPPDTIATLAAATSAQSWFSRLAVLKPHFFALDNHYANETLSKEEGFDLSRIMMNAVERAGERLKKRRETHSEKG